MDDTPQSAALPQLNHALQSALAAFKRRSDRFAAVLEQLPKLKPCDRCGHEGAALNVDRSFESGRPFYDCEPCESIERRERWRRRQEAAGIPEDVRHASFDNWAPGDPVGQSDHPTKVIEAVRQVIDGRLRNLILAGTPGVGKGHAAATVANEFLNGQQKVRWRVMHRLLEASHRAYEDGTRQDLIEQHASVSLLILDEVAMSELPRDGERFVYDLVDLRQKRRLPTIMTTNKPAEVVRDWLGAPTTDRLRSGGVKFLWLEWTSARGRKTIDGAF